jgi:hypothetical protein
VAKKISSRLIKPRRFFFDAFIFEDLKSNLLGFFVNFLFQTQMPLERHCGRIKNIHRLPKSRLRRGNLLFANLRAFPS